MAQKNYKVGEAIEVVYQALNAATGATVNMEVYDATHTIVVGGPTVLTELGASGRYYGSFIADVVGEWSVQIQESDGTGKVVKAFSVGSHHLQDVGATVDSIADDTTALGTNVGIVEGKVDSANTKVDALDTKANTTHTKVDAVDAKIDALDADIVAVDAKISGLASPPMIG